MNKYPEIDNMPFFIYFTCFLTLYTCYVKLNSKINLILKLNNRNKISESISSGIKLKPYGECPCSTTRDVSILQTRNFQKYYEILKFLRSQKPSKKRPYYVLIKSKEKNNSIKLPMVSFFKIKTVLRKIVISKYRCTI